MKYKTCTKCGNEKLLIDFYGDKRARDGKQSCCKVCHKAGRQTEEVKARRRATYDPTKRKEAYQKRKDRALARNREYYRENKERKLSYGKKHYQQNKSKYAEYTRTRQAKILQRTPDWLSEDHKAELQDFYWLAKDLTAVSGETYHVDHIVPLQGDNVCGLHVPWNLQILPADINLSKGNRYADNA